MRAVPWADDPYTSQDLGAKARSSHGRSARSGAGGFGSMSARELRVQSAGSDTPGPGTYTQGGGLVDKNPNKPSSAFRSTSSQRMKGHTEDVPGIGSYDPNMGSVEPNNAGSISSMRSKAERFKGESVTTEPAVGPGAYANEDHNSMAASVATSVMRSSRGGAGFGTKTPQHQLPINASVAAVPGPGAYEVLHVFELYDAAIVLADSSAVSPSSSHILCAAEPHHRVSQGPGTAVGNPPRRV